MTGAPQGQQGDICPKEQRHGLKHPGKRREVAVQKAFDKSEFSRGEHIVHE
jgi:hypothetical protein